MNNRHIPCTRLIYNNYLFLFDLISILACSTSQESDWIYFNSTCYFYSKDKRLRFTKAREYCRTFKNSELTSIYNKDENEFIRRRINELAEDYQYTWIGLAIDNTNKTYWYQNPLHSLAYINWLYPEKNRDSNLCTAMLPNGYWIEVDCFNEFSFICKKSMNFFNYSYISHSLFIY